MLSLVLEQVVHGPNLTTFGDRNRVAGFLEHNEESLKAWIKTLRNLNRVT